MLCTWKAMSTFKHFPAILRPAIFLLMASTLQAQSSPASQSSLKGQPHLFGPGAISTQDVEANASFTPAGTLAVQQSGKRLESECRNRRNLHCLLQQLSRWFGRIRLVRQLSPARRKLGGTKKPGIVHQFQFL